ncbi:hypothetical protein ERU76_18065 [Escherichia coli]|nr:hypothetical protein [Escherichia coli]EEV6916226.1 hypothetical protein [Escherichia coli]EEV7623618.1 hypothetical protein [Escherichia coli]EEV8625485.1 hypothetical protein [Escherichia coli]EEW6025814.1 hypothetical protein [Escherichia coli]
MKFFSVFREVFTITQMAGAIKQYDIKRVFILYVRQATIAKGSHQTTIKQRRQTRCGLHKIKIQNKTEKRIATRRKARKTIAADVAFLYTSCYLRYAEHINLWSAL